MYINNKTKKFLCLDLQNTPPSKEKIEGGGGRKRGYLKDIICSQTNSAMPLLRNRRKNNKGQTLRNKNLFHLPL
jgi:hypothetical protein